MRERDWKKWIVQNGSYKLVALFVTLILWVTIFGRRDFQTTRELDIEYLLPPGISLVDKNIQKKVNIKVSGSRLALNRFSKGPGVLTVDLGRSRPGKVSTILSSKQIDVPFGVKVISISPDMLELELESSGVH